MERTCIECKKFKKIHAYGLCDKCYHQKWTAKDSYLFELKIGSIHFIIKKRYRSKAEFMKTYMQKNRKRINAYNRYRYQNNIAGSRDNHLKREKKRNNK